MTTYRKPSGYAHATCSASKAFRQERPIPVLDVAGPRGVQPLPATDHHAQAQRVAQQHEDVKARCRRMRMVFVANPGINLDGSPQGGWLPRYEHVKRNEHGEVVSQAYQPHAPAKRNPGNGPKVPLEGAEVIEEWKTWRKNGKAPPAGVSDAGKLARLLGLESKPPHPEPFTYTPKRPPQVVRKSMAYIQVEQAMRGDERPSVFRHNRSVSADEPRVSRVANMMTHASRRLIRSYAVLGRAA